MKQRPTALQWSAAILVVIALLSDLFGGIFRDLLTYALLVPFLAALGGVALAIWAFAVAMLGGGHRGTRSTR